MQNAMDVLNSMGTTGIPTADAGVSAAQNAMQGAGGQTASDILGLTFGSGGNKSASQLLAGMGGGTTPNASSMITTPKTAAITNPVSQTQPVTQTQGAVTQAVPQFSAAKAATYSGPSQNEIEAMRAGMNEALATRNKSVMGSPEMVDAAKLFTDRKAAYQAAVDKYNQYKT